MWGAGLLTSDTYYFTPSTAQWQALRQLFETPPPLPKKPAKDDHLRAVLEQCSDKGSRPTDRHRHERHGVSMLSYLFTCEGRSGRTEFLLMSAVYAIIYAGLDTVLVQATGAGSKDLYESPGWIVISIFGLLVGYVWAMVSLIGRRFHDMNANAWYSAIAFVPLLNAGLLLYLLLRPGTDGPNEYDER
jgi:uncharacterized membrane protein YhaH (DUF805 family)